MEAEVYEDIVVSIRSRGWGDLDRLQEEICQEFPEAASQSVKSILHQENQRHVKSAFRAEHSDSNKSAVYSRVQDSLQRGEESGVIIRLAQETGFSPALTARAVLDTHYQEDRRQRPEDGAKSKVNLMMKDSTLIEDGKLAMEVFLATLKDDSYGHLAEAIKQSVGEEHEQRLKDILTRLQIPFCDEHHLRSQGYDKTPDIKLEIPISVDGFIINWIESKALFGDPEAHRGYLRDQLWSYLNRFGSGMVIYWFGYVGSLDSNRSAGIMLSSSFPENFVRYNPEMIRRDDQSNENSEF